MIARYVAHERRDQVLGLATLAGVYEATHQARVLPRRQVVREDASVLALAGPARDDYEEMAVVQSEATLDAFTRYALPGLRGANQSILGRVAEQYALSVEPEIAHPAPFDAPSLHLRGPPVLQVAPSKRSHSTLKDIPVGVSPQSAAHGLRPRRPPAYGTAWEP